ncbi:hypothetical protein NQZ68_006093 [Dissostichus eleginoides]|nr:hypothetical protein NQZ68_006093 [Dissostichus eleginoides]
MAHFALGEYVTLNIPPLRFPRLYYTSTVDVFDYGERQAFARRIKGRGSAPQSLCPPGGASPPLGRLQGLGQPYGGRSPRRSQSDKLDQLQHFLTEARAAPPSR